MLKIEIEVKNRMANTSKKGLATTEESFAAYQALLIAAKDIEQMLVSAYSEESGKSYEESQKAFNRVVEGMQAVVKKWKK